MTMGKEMQLVENEEMVECLMFNTWGMISDA